MTLLDPQEEAVTRLWDELADTDAGRIAEARDHCMAVLGVWLQAKNAGWVASVRPGVEAGDPMHGWRIGATAYLHTERVNSEAVAALKVRWAKREVDPLTLHSLRGAGEAFRAFSLRKAMPPCWFERPYYHDFYAARGVHDAIIAVFPLNADAESTFVFHGNEARGAFTSEDIKLTARALRGLKWFHRQLMLSYGLLVASAPLSPAERKVLQILLTGDPEKEIARKLGLAASTVHQYIIGIYRKFGVRGRAGLMSLWLSRAG